MFPRWYLCLFFLFVTQYQAYAQINGFRLNDAVNRLPSIQGKSQNREYLYTTAGNRLYCIGNQGGQFPEVGFHVPGEMGGIWQQPFKLMDGFGFTLRDKHTGQSFDPVCDQFIAYSFATKFHYTIAAENIQVTQTQFVPDDLPVLVVEYKIHNTTTTVRNIAFEWQADINLMPVWLGERLGIQDAPDHFISFDSSRRLLVFKDGSNNWYTGIHVENTNARLLEIKKTTYKGKGITGIIQVNLEIPPRGSAFIRMYISGSEKNSVALYEQIAQVKKNLPELFEQKFRRYRQIEKTGEIKVPDSLVQTAYNWGKYATDWLRRDVPGLGSGLSAGLPDYPWFFSNDQAATFMALTGTMPPALFYESFNTLKRISDKVNDSSGRILHEVSANGVVYNKGNMQESQLHIIAAWQIFQWTGNIHFLKENYIYAQKTWKWLQQHDTNHNGYIEGYGGVEIEGMNEEMLDVQINTFRFLEILSQMAAIFRDPEASADYAEKAARLKDKINREWWVESEGLYADFLTSSEKALKIIDGALATRVKPDRNHWALVKLNALKIAVSENKYRDSGYLVYYNAGNLEPVTTGMVDTARALRILEKESFFTNRFGAYIAGIERPDDITLDEKSFQKDSNFTYNRAVMPAATAGLIIAAARYGMPDTALRYMHRMLNTFSYATPGTTYEVSPDYGMFVQAWNISCLNIPLIQYFFGIRPDAYKKEIMIYPQIPDHWNKASIKNLIVGNTMISFQYKKDGDRVTCILQSTEPGWKIHFISGVSDAQLTWNHKPLATDQQWIPLGTDKNTIQFVKGK
jgi:glycogen debranching enzyme